MNFGGSLVVGGRVIRLLAREAARREEGWAPRMRQ